jgi:transposase-like protein
MFFQPDLDRCPHCGGNNLDVETTPEITREIHVRVSCEDCGETWVDVYKYVDSYH